MSDLDRRIERQGATVARLARQLQFERLMLQRLRQRAGIQGRGNATEAEPAAVIGSISEVYAAALLRQIEADAPARAAAEPDVKP
ncbi:hypothetical protein [Aureimonas sp. AU12]|uniref:hypothetical protein n=1 Tax=Aureimonas sp. AU12 TaxID=1638161 RepID=UPI0007851251|nr:hypothetical protein [Aureimonas sp. AU12]